MFRGTKEQIFRQAQRPILEAWLREKYIPDPNGWDGPGKGFKQVSKDCPLLIQVGRRPAVEKFLHEVQVNCTPQAYCYQIDPGRVYVYPDKVFRDEVPNIKLPDGYDSILLTFDINDQRGDIQGESLLAQGHQQSSVYSQYYMIFDEKRIAPAYRISFIFNPVKTDPKLTEKVVCSVCNSKAVTTFCQSEREFFCTIHDYERHRDQIRVVQEAVKGDAAEAQIVVHQRVTVDPKIIMAARDLTIVYKDDCSIAGHDYKKLDFFCIDCNRGLCTTCLIQDAASHQQHKIVDTKEEFQKTIEEVENAEAMVNKSTKQKLIHLKNQMQEVLDRIIKFKDETERQEEKLQRMFEIMLTQVRQRFNYKSNRLRADFVELQRQEQELRMSADFIHEEMDFWKKGRGSGIPPQKIYLIEELQTHKKVLEFLKSQKSELQGTENVYEDLKFDRIIKALRDGVEPASLGEGSCPSCADRAAEVAAGGDIKGQILARAKISISKHLRDANRKQLEMNKDQFLGTEKSRKSDAIAQIAEKQTKPKKSIPSNQILGKLQKVQNKIQKMINLQKRQSFDVMNSDTSPNTRDMGIVWNSVLGTFNKTFDGEEFRGEEKRLKKIFKDSDILTGIQPWIMYFNLPYLEFFRNLG